jgi:Uma2 family endonuclease
MAIQSRSLTYDDLQRMRTTRDERLELIDGELFVTPSPTTIHQRVIRRLHRLLERAIIEAAVGEFFPAPYDVKLADGSIVQPDLVAVLTERFPLVAADKIEGVPDFIIEVLSPSSKTHDRIRKRDLYARHGVPEYWLVDPDARSVTIFSDPRDGRYRAEQMTSDVAISATIPQLSADLKALFAPVPGL